MKIRILLLGIWISIFILFFAVFVGSCIKEEPEDPPRLIANFDDFPEFPQDPLFKDDSTLWTPVRSGCPYQVAMQFDELLAYYWDRTPEDYYVRATGFAIGGFANQEYIDVQWHDQQDNIPSNIDFREWYCHVTWNGCKNIHSRATLQDCLGCSDLQRIYQSGNTFLFITYAPELNENYYFGQLMRLKEP